MGGRILKTKHGYKGDVVVLTQSHLSIVVVVVAAVVCQPEEVPITLAGALRGPGPGVEVSLAQHQEARGDGHAPRPAPGQPSSCNTQAVVTI